VPLGVSSVIHGTVVVAFHEHEASALTETLMLVPAAAADALSGETP
jgi:hypothetical protein